MSDTVNQPADLFDMLIGKKIDDARTMADRYDYVIRLVKRNGVALVCTCDYRTNRINVEIVDDVVTKVRGIG